MTYLPRTLEGPLSRTSAQWPVLLVTGPRQVGKTTFLRHLSGRGPTRRATILS
jgi:predicted AAA+ superfamily ATPase